MAVAAARAGVHETWPAGLVVRTRGKKGHRHSAKDTALVHPLSQIVQGAGPRSRARSLSSTSSVALPSSKVLGLGNLAQLSYSELPPSFSGL